MLIITVGIVYCITGLVIWYLTSLDYNAYFLDIDLLWVMNSIRMDDSSMMVWPNMIQTDDNENIMVIDDVDCNVNDVNDNDVNDNDDDHNTHIHTYILIIGSDPKWTAIHKDDYTNYALHFYNSSLVNTNDGFLNITTIIQDVTFSYDDVKVAWQQLYLSLYHIYSFISIFISYLFIHIYLYIISIHSYLSLYHIYSFIYPSILPIYQSIYHICISYLYIISIYHIYISYLSIISIYHIHLSIYHIYHIDR